MTVTRLISGLLSLYCAVIGAFMVVASRAWYDTTPGVTEAGPYNGHFIPDIGFIFLVSAACFGFWAWRPALGRALLAAGAAWPAIHALFHLTHWTEGVPTGAALLTEIVGLFIPAALGVAITLRAPPSAGRFQT